MDIVDAIAERDSTRAVRLINEYHLAITKRMQSSPRAKELRETDPGLTATLSTWLRTDEGFVSRPDRKG